MVTGALVGTAGYMSPEQADGRDEDVDTRSDVFSLGATLFMMLTNRHPSQRTLVDENYRLCTRPLEAICEKAMQPDPDQRYQSAKAMADEVEQYLAGQPVSVYSPSLLEKWFRFGKRR